MRFRALHVSLASLAVVALVCALSERGTGQEPAPAPAPKSKKVVKTDAEWRKLLTRDQYLVTRQAFTEPAFTGKLVNNHAKGVYECVCCGTELFSSKTKFESGTGWPSFYAPFDKQNIQTAVDYKEGYPRTEVKCANCDAHLGHVFDDGPAPTGLRFCMNSAALKFVKEVPPAKKPTAKEKAAEKTSEKTGKAEKTDKAEKTEKSTETPAKAEAPAKAETPATGAPK